MIAEYGPSGQEAQGGLVRARIYRGGGLIATDEAVGKCRRTAEQFVRNGLKFWVERIALQGRDGVREGFEVSNEFAAQGGGVCSPGEPRG